MEMELSGWIGGIMTSDFVLNIKQIIFGMLRSCKYFFGHDTNKYLYDSWSVPLCFFPLFGSNMEKPLEREKPSAPMYTFVSYLSYPVVDKQIHVHSDSCPRSNLNLQACSRTHTFAFKKSLQHMVNTPMLYLFRAK